MTARAALAAFVAGGATPILRDLGGWGAPFFLAAAATPFARPGIAGFWSLGFVLAEVAPVALATGRYLPALGIALGGVMALALFPFVYAPFRLFPRPALPFAWVASEVVRLALLKAAAGILGYGLVDAPIALVGGFGGVYLVSLLAIALGLLIWERPAWGVVAALLALPWPLPVRFTQTSSILMVQAGLTPETKHLAAEIYPALTTQFLKRHPTFDGLVIWPEAATPQPPTDGPLWRWLGGIGGGTANAVALVEGSEVVAMRSKAYLVPIAEYLPPPFSELRRHALQALVGNQIQLPDNYAPQPGELRPLGKYGALICYEGALEGAASAMRKAGAEVLITITNENTFDGTTYKQRRLREDRMRSIETGLWDLRLAETGPSAVIDPLGRVVDQLPEGKRIARVVSYGQEALPTPYPALRPFLIALYLAAPIAVALARRSKREDKSDDAKA